MGPGGVGKTTLIRTLARINDAFPSYWWRGAVYFGSEDYLRDVGIDESADLVRLLAQKAKLYTASVLDNLVETDNRESPPSRAEKLAEAEALLARFGADPAVFSCSLSEPAISLRIGEQRFLALLRLASRRPRCLLLDEPLRDLAPEDEARIVELLLRLKQEHAILMVTHNQRYARELGDCVHLLTAGSIVASADCPAFFLKPPNELAEVYVRCGNVWPTDDSSPVDASIEAENEPTDRDTSLSDRGPLRSAADVAPPAGFHWIIQDRFGSMMKPGLLRDIDADLAGLRALGVQTLITLTESDPAIEKLREYGVDSIHVPIVDMSVPDLATARDLCRRIAEGLDAGERIVVHCKAGLGRTGTILACTLVYRGLSAVDAINTIRMKNSRYIQTDEQAAFVALFESYLGTAEAGEAAQSSPAVRNEHAPRESAR